MPTLRSRKRYPRPQRGTRTQPLRTANTSLRSDTNVCEVMNKKACKFLRKNPQVYVTNIANQTKSHKGDCSEQAYSSSDIYINKEMFDVNPRSKVFIAQKTPGKGVFQTQEDEEGNKYWTSFNSSITKRWVVVKIALPGHYAVALVDQHLKKVEFFDSGGVHEDWIIKKVRALFAAILPAAKINIVQTMMLQMDDYDGYCQTWIWVWLYFRLSKEWSHVQFKKVFQKMEEKERTECVRTAHYFLIGR